MADRPLELPTSIFWSRAIQLRGFKKRTSFCSTFCARSSRLGSVKPKTVEAGVPPAIPDTQQPTRLPLQDHSAFFSSRSRSRFNCRRSLAVKLPIPNFEILSRIGSIEAQTSSDSAGRVGRIFGTTRYFGFGSKRVFKALHQANSGPAPLHSMKRNAA